MENLSFTCFKKDKAFVKVIFTSLQEEDLELIDRGFDHIGMTSLTKVYTDDFPPEKEGGDTSSSPDTFLHIKSKDVET